jgi:hypothetical protein
VSRSRSIFWVLLPPLIVTAVVLVFLAGLAFSGLVLVRGDTLSYFYPYWDIRNAAWTAGETLSWTDAVFTGAPLLANPQVGVYYPPNWLTAGLRAPAAVSISALAHLLWAGVGTYTLYRARVGGRRISALLAAVAFALGGYMGAHVEQINQLQGLSWLPWAIWAADGAARASQPRRGLWYSGLLAAILALQVFSGHTQTVFITVVGLGLYTLVMAPQGPGRRWGLQSLLGVWLLLGASAVLALLLAAPQILPTLELTGLSGRGGGLNPLEATAFSLPPAALGHALFPRFDGLLFTEYIVTIGTVGLGLAVIGLCAAQPEKARARLAWGVLLLAGLLAFGRYNPLYFGVLAPLPGFDLFRVPARWLALVALALAMLAGIGLDALITGVRLRMRLVLPLLLALAALALLSGIWLLPPAGDFAGTASPPWWVVALWLGGLLFVYLVARLLPILPARTGLVSLLALVAVLELFAATRVLPYNDLAPADVYLGQRFTTSQLLAYQDEANPPTRVLGISDLRFDLGDRAQQEARFAALGMDDVAVRNALVALKRQEVLFPNLGMPHGIPSLDGFDGGVLPLEAYSQFAALLLPADAPRTVDGRLGEWLARPECRGACMPDLRWLALTHTGFIITDKVHDIWHQDVAYDTAWPREGGATYRHQPFQATAIRLLVRSAAAPDGQAVTVDGHTLPLAFTQAAALPEWQGLTLYHAALPGPTDVDHVVVSLAGGTSDALSVVDERSGAFLQLHPEPVTRLLSSDIKLYGVPTLPRAFVVHTIEVLPDSWAGSESALAQMRAPDWDPARTAIVHDSGARLTSHAGPEPQAGEGVVFEETGPGRLRARVSAAADGFVVVSDAHYPGWTATLNGAPVALYRANILFRAVPVPAGEHILEMTFASPIIGQAQATGLAAWLLWGVMLGGLWLAGRRAYLADGRARYQ